MDCGVLQGSPQISHVSFIFPFKPSSLLGSLWKPLFIRLRDHHSGVAGRVKKRETMVLLLIVFHHQMYLVEVLLLDFSFIQVFNQTGQELRPIYDIYIYMYIYIYTSKIRLKSSFFFQISVPKNVTQMKNDQNGQCLSSTSWTRGKSSHQKFFTATHHGCCRRSKLVGGFNKPL